MTDIVEIRERLARIEERGICLEEKIDQPSAYGSVAVHLA
jgi:hypothetical protein